MSVFDGGKFIELVESVPATGPTDEQTRALMVGMARGFVRLVQCLERIAAAQETRAAPPPGTAGQ